MASGLEKAVIMARGLGTRMRREDASAELSREQLEAAGAGVKAMMPIGRPFLDYVLSGLADAGYRHVCLVIGPEHQMMRDYYTRQAPPRRVRVHFAVQEKPLGTADAVSSAEAFAGKDLFLVINSDNYYPADVLRRMGELDQPGVALFEREHLIAESNIPEDRILKFAVARVDEDGCLGRIYEKPDRDTVCGLGFPVLVSMNCWVFSPRIFKACRAVRPSPRGELELTDAVQGSMEALGERYKALCFRSSVLDLSSRSDVAAVAARLRDVRPDP